MAVTPYPRLHEIKRQLGLLHKLYNLYNNVIETVNGYYDILWSEIKIDNINDELSEFQNRSEHTKVFGFCVEVYIF